MGIGKGSVGVTPLPWIGVISFILAVELAINLSKNISFGARVTDRCS